MNFQNTYIDATVHLLSVVVLTITAQQGGAIVTTKYAARGISTQMRTAEGLLFTDGITLKPVNGGDVFVEDEKV